MAKFKCIIYSSKYILRRGAWTLCFCVRLCVTLWTVARQAPQSLGFSRQEFWSGLPCPPPGNLPNPGIEPKSPTLQVYSLPAEPPGKPNNLIMKSVKFSKVKGYKLIAKFRHKLKKVGKITRPFRYDLNQIHYSGSDK